MDFKKIREKVEGHSLPMLYENEDHEYVVVSEGCLIGVRFYRLFTLQHNGWCRINIYYENGATEEMYVK